MSGIAHKRTMRWKPAHEDDPNAVMARPAIFGNELGAVRDRTEALLDGFDYETTFLESHFVNDLSPEATLEELVLGDEGVRWQNEELLRLGWELDAERRKNEELKAKIEERVRRRSVELYQVLQLKDELLVREQRARSDAEAANRSKDEFLAFVAHELRTPLSAILGWAQLMRSKMGDEAKRARAAEVIERSALDQARIINDILDVSRIVTGNLQLDLRSLELASVVQAAIEAARPAIDAKGIHLDTMLDESIGALTGDFSRLQQVVGNILSNSIKFTPAGGTIAITLDRAGDSARLIVTDTGDGISAAFLPFVFDRFRQAQGETIKRQGGLGLGLAIVNHLVRMHGGTVEAFSEGEGKGSTFTLNLPVDTASQAESNVLVTESRVVHARNERLEFSASECHSGGCRCYAAIKGL